MAALVAATTTLTACNSGGSGSAAGRVLTLWHYEAADSAMGLAWSQAVKDFEAAHPGVTVKVETKTFEQLQKTAAMVLNSSNAPDILEYNKGNATAGLLSKQGLLTDLTPEVAQYGWDRKLSSNLAVTSRYSNGVMGSGDWYGIPNYAEYAMVYYNVDLFNKYHVPVPKTFADFTAAMDTFVKNGITPLADAGAEYPAQQYLYDLALSKADPAWVTDYQIKGKADFHDAAWSYAASTLADWVRKGYIAKNSVSLKATDMGNAFESGKSPMMVSGSWWYGTFESEIKNFAWDTFLWPGSSLVPGSGGNLWVVPSKSGNKQLAYDFINITLQKDVQDVIANKGAVPVAANPADVTDPKAKELIQHYDTLAASGGLAYYPDWPVPGFYDTLTAATQDLINGKDPNSVLGSLQTAYQQGLNQ
ncbi:extracellular solute-binding protein [Actinocrinis sp.]|uniref:ABC transporter substrate-binding protein n=1 Tax=Actinocrinis sp. TaxID=1920516 RepID=UPI002D34B16E|nr:extracellular solute-binding protein [Actinocrinis sp.]HZP52897.1 extracellular solute-binding protein [Actinocrinis sp.]